MHKNAFLCLLVGLSGPCARVHLAACDPCKPVTLCVYERGAPGTSVCTDVTGAHHAYDGPAMYLELRKLLDKPGPTHRISAYQLSGTSGGSGSCFVILLYQTTSHASNTSRRYTLFLLTVHRPNFEAIRLERAVLTDVLINLLPECNAQEGRTIRRKLLIAARKQTDYEEDKRHWLRQDGE